MDCPHCNRTLTEAEAAGPKCPHCGRSLEKSPVRILKTSSVRVAVGDQDKVYGSIRDIPAEVRRKIQRALNGPNSETILIADDRGREQIFQIITGLPLHLQKKVLASIQFTGQSTPQRLTRRVRIVIALASAIILLALTWWVWR